MYPDRLIVLGQAKVGKTSIVQQFAEESYSRTYTPTIEDVSTLVLKHPDGMYHAVEVVDTSGGDDYPAMRKLRIAQGHRFLVVYAVNELETLNAAIRLCRMVYDYKNEQAFPILLVGNKMDIVSSRSVSTEMALSVTREFNCPHVEVSAKINLNIKCMFNMIMAMELPKRAGGATCRDMSDYTPILRAHTFPTISRDSVFVASSRSSSSASLSYFPT